jgi:hypothetical protein
MTPEEKDKTTDQTNTKTANNKSPRRRAGKESIAIIVLAVIILLLIGFGSWLLVSGKASVAWSGSSHSQTAADQAGNGVRDDKPLRVCNGTTVGVYNNAMYATPKSVPGPSSIDKKGLDKLAAKIKKRDGYKNDPTCQTILFWTAFENNDYKAIKPAYNALVRLHKNNKFPDNNLRNSGSLFQYKGIVKSLSPAVKKENSTKSVS